MVVGMNYPHVTKYRTMGNPIILRGTVEPAHTAVHNKRSWIKIEPFIDEGWTLEELTSKLGSHDGPWPFPRSFVLYCCDLGYLRVKKVAL
jgi:hypothetical protein